MAGKHEKTYVKRSEITIETMTVTRIRRNVGFDRQSVVRDERCEEDERQKAIDQLSDKRDKQ